MAFLFIALDEIADEAVAIHSQIFVRERLKHIPPLIVPISLHHSGTLP
jgi:hypothetical protein